MRPGQNQQNRRGRARNNNNNNNNNGPNQNRKGQNPLSRSFESNGPDVKVRGTPAHIAEKYVTLARDAQSAGDRVLAENYLQHAEHYNRIIMAYREQFQSPSDPAAGATRRMPGTDGFDLAEDGSEDDDGDESNEDFGGGPQPNAPMNAGGGEAQVNPRPPHRPEQRQDGNRQDNRPDNRYDRGGNTDRNNDNQQRGDRPFRRDQQQNRFRGNDRNDRNNRPNGSSDRGYEPRFDRGDRPDQRQDYRSDRGPRPERPDRQPSDRPQQDRFAERAPDRPHDQRPERIERPAQQFEPATTPPPVVHEVPAQIAAPANVSTPAVAPTPVPPAAPVRRRERLADQPTHEQPEFLRRPVRRTRAAPATATVEGPATDAPSTTGGDEPTGNT